MGKRLKEMQRAMDAWPNSRAGTDNSGKPCPKCRRPMDPSGWKPRPAQPFYFAAWDYCARCRHVQHYEAMKRYVNEPEVDAAPPALPTNPAVKIPPDRFIPEKFRTMRWRPHFGGWE